MKFQVDPNIQITHIGPEHANVLYELTNKNRAYLKQWLGWIDLVQTYEDTETFIETAIDQHNNNQASTFVIFYEQTLVGVAGFNQLDHVNRWGTIGYWLCESFTGKGIVTKVVNQLLDYGFEEHNLHKIEIRCATQNLKSKAVIERLGLTYEAELRECEWLYDKFVDHCVYSILSEEFKSSLIKTETLSSKQDS
ncbi:GNAT family N-acetyltransferase [Paraglaciecola sp. 2405UD69-4]|uniref:GNAT family N-acetyltransferase n=1 Tax=Paraglaciecola sp. 2405UD69-4 TaxID=3391836 RepID=UPI0039C9D997